MTPTAILAAFAVVLALVLIAREIRFRSETPDAFEDDPRDEPNVDRAHRGDTVNRELLDFGVAEQPTGREAPTFFVFEASELLAVNHLRGMEGVEELLRRLTEDVRTARRSPPPRPRRPTSVLLHGPPGGAMTIVVHELARALGARLVQLFATRSLPTTNGGAQPKVAAAVSQARDHLSSVLMIDELEYVAAVSVRGAERLRAANDLLAEALRPVYGASHVVVGVFTTYDDRPLPRRIVNAFEHLLEVELPELEWALRAYALRTGGRALFRAIPTSRLAEHPDVASPPRHGAA